MEVHETVAEPDPVMVRGIIVPQVKPAGTLFARLTTPLNAFSAVIVIVGTEDCPESTGDDWETVIEKSGNARTVTVTAAE